MGLRGGTEGAGIEGGRELGEVGLGGGAEFKERGIHMVGMSGLGDLGAGEVRGY